MSQDTEKKRETKQYPAPLLSVDSVVFTVTNKILKVLLVKRAIAPYKSQWSLPGGYIDLEKDQTTRDTAIRKIKQKTNINAPYLEQLQTVSSTNRDPRGWSATVVYFSLISHQQTETDLGLVEDTEWVSVQELIDNNSSFQPLAFDHQLILDIAIERLRQKALYSMLPIFCLKKEFTLSEYHQVMEVILDRKIQKKSLYRRFEASAMFEETGKLQATGARAAVLYRLKKGVELINFERNLG